MEELTKHKIFTMEAAKRDALLTAAMSKFAKNGYKKTTTDEIILEAEISKGLLFHYFGTKRDLYIFLFQYAITTIMQEYYAQIDMKERDILKRMRNTFFLKLKLTDKYPAIFDFVATAFLKRTLRLLKKFISTQIKCISMHIMRQLKTLINLFLKKILIFKKLLILSYLP